jgi:hypothetical protein
MFIIIQQLQLLELLQLEHQLQPQEFLLQELLAQLEFLQLVLLLFLL